MKRSVSLGLRGIWWTLALASLPVACSRHTTTSASPIPAPTSPATIEPTLANARVVAPALPSRLSDADYWKLENDISEPGGYFQIEDNYTSNEREIGQLYTMLRDQRVSGGVYLGVGPEQNLTYIAAIRPRMAFIVDIRRQAVMQHMMFKAMFELAKDRGDFVSILFGKPRPAGIDTATPIQRIWELYRPVASDSALSSRNYKLIVDRLTKTHGFTFTDDESAKLKAVYGAFYYFGPAITTRGYNSGRGAGSDFSDLTGFSVDAANQPRSFLSSEDNYQYVKMLQEKNLIIPVSGDFGGPKAIRAIGSYLAEHGGTVSAFYVSNVEQYLFQDGKAQAFYDNVATLPVDTTGVFIRPYSMRRGFNDGGGMTQSLCPIGRFIVAARAGKVQSNNAALACIE
jgi:hypothetical protein